jgi:hypothetical protein
MVQVRSCLPRRPPRSAYSGMSLLRLSTNMGKRSGNYA